MHQVSFIIIIYIYIYIYGVMKEMNVRVMERRATSRVNEEERIWKFTKYCLRI